LYSRTKIKYCAYVDWAEDTFPPESLDYTRWSILFFAFATPNSSSTLTWDAGSQAMLTRTVAAAKASGAGTRIVLSVGGWAGSVYFSQCVSTAANRTTFVNTLASAVTTYGLDGIDIDWEYPNQVGAGNIHSPSDSANLLLFLTQLRAALGSSKIISAAVPDEPWLGANGSPLTNVSAYAAQMTYLNIMNYDVFQSSSTPGPNAPLGNLCGTSTLPNYSAEAAFTQWTSAGFPASKMLLGLPLYGYVSNSTKTTLTGSFVDPAPTTEEGQGGANPKGKHARPRTSPTPIKPVKKTAPTAGGTTEGTGKTKTGTDVNGSHSKHKAPNGSSPIPKDPNGSASMPNETNGTTNTPSTDVPSTDVPPTDTPSTDAPSTDVPSTDTPSTNATADLQSWYGQEIPFSSIVASGALVELPGGTFGGGGGFTEGWDNCSDTPFLFNTSQSTVVTYDDTFSLGDKATFAKTSGMAGCFTWSLDQDDGVILQNVIRASLGLS
jgi:chitinase